MNFILSQELDYSLLSLNARKEKVEEILDRHEENLLDYYENYLKVNIGQSGKTSEFDTVTKDLEKVADYLLYMDNKEQREKMKQEKLLNKRQTDNRKKKEVLTDNFTFVENDKREISKNVRIYGKIKVFEQDRKEHKELAETGRMIATLKEQILSKKDSNGKQLSNEQLKKLRWYLIEIGKDEIAIKEQLKRYITFKNIQPTFPFYNIDNFSFANPKHVKALFENYKQLKESYKNKTENNFKDLIFIFEDLVSKTIKEPILKTIFEAKLDGKIQNYIRKEIFIKFNIEITQQRISQILDETIPNLIVQRYKQEFEDFIFTFKKKGKYQTCSKCRNNLLANTKYFHKEPKGENGLKKICKNCYKK